MKSTFYAGVLPFAAAGFLMACSASVPAYDDEAEAIASTEQAARCEDCPGSGGGGWEPREPRPRPVPPPNPDDQGPGIKVADFRRRAEADAQNNGRCLVTPDQAYCEEQLNYAYNPGAGRYLITKATRDWGATNGFYPSIDRADHVIAICKCGCFDASTRLLAVDEQDRAAWVKAREIRSGDHLMSLDEGSSLIAPRTRAKQVAYDTQGIESPELFVFSLSSGRVLKVTQHHGMLLSDGRVVAAKDVTMDDSFVALDGEKVAITAIGREQTNEKVHNFEVRANDKDGHFVVAEGVFVGDLAWQNQLARELGAIAVRR